MGRMIYTTKDGRKKEETKIIYSEEIYSCRDYTQEELQKLIPSWEDNEYE